MMKCHECKWLRPDETDPKYKACYFPVASYEDCPAFDDGKSDKAVDGLIDVLKRMYALDVLERSELSDAITAVELARRTR